MASNSTATLTSLLRNTTIEDHDEILKAANAVLKTSKLDPDALHTRAVALLKLDRFEDALRALDDGGDKLAQQCVLERAYALYKTGKLEDAERVCNEGGVGDKGRGLKHVAAQVAYRAEKFDHARQVYGDLVRGGMDYEAEEMDLRINGMAVDAQMGWQGKSLDLGARNEDLEAFETAYNAACGCIAKGDYKKGSILLKSARNLCESLEELSDEEKRAEVLPIMVQQAFVLTKLGKVEEAAVLRKMIDIADVPEPPTKVIAQNNSLAISKDEENPYMVQKIFDEVPSLSHGERLFEHQANILQRNRYTIDLQVKKYTGVAKSTLKAINKVPAPTTSPWINSLSVLNAAAHAQSETGKAGLKEILPLLEKRPKDIGLLLTIIQLYILTSNPSPAIILLETFLKRLEESTNSQDQDARFAPGLVALLASLYRVSNRKSSVKSELAKAASYWQGKSQPSPALFRAAGISLLESPSNEDAAAASKIFSSLLQEDPTDRIALAGSVAASPSNSSKTENLAPISQLIAGIDAAALEEAGIPSLPTIPQPSSRKRALESEKKEEEKEKPRKKLAVGTRKSKLPKDFEEGKKMDPERWLPVRDRSSYKPKGKKGKKKAAGADLTQGGAVRDDALEGVEPVSTAGKVVTGGAAKGKKKKGKR